VVLCSVGSAGRTTRACNGPSAFGVRPLTRRVVVPTWVLCCEALLLDMPLSEDQRGLVASLFGSFAVARRMSLTIRMSSAACLGNRSSGAMW